MNILLATQTFSSSMNTAIDFLRDNLNHQQFEGSDWVSLHASLCGGLTTYWIFATIATLEQLKGTHQHKHRPTYPTDPTTNPADTNTESTDTNTRLTDSTDLTNTVILQPVKDQPLSVALAEMID
ncbi:hypothetical protein ElyMa_004795000 [Elysia marginata]|uniref:Uncharacterized protein n=1 Tax=Elysia marginata TaxID=1093978 RepID=A0AAV4IHY4_9GAST|nr:hypothetical protein ElyMa_004795000 [Elysia marginata]